MSIAKKIGEGAYDTLIEKINKIKYDKYINPVIEATQFFRQMIYQDTQIPPLRLNILDLSIVLVCFSYIFATLFIITHNAANHWRQKAERRRIVVF